MEPIPEPEAPSAIPEQETLGIGTRTVSDDFATTIRHLRMA